MYVMNRNPDLQYVNLCHLQTDRFYRQLGDVLLVSSKAEMTSHGTQYLNEVLMCCLK